MENESPQSNIEPTPDTVVNITHTDVVPESPDDGQFPLANLSQLFAATSTVPTFTPRKVSEQVRIGSNALYIYNPSTKAWITLAPSTSPWTRYSSFSWSNATATKSLTSLPAHDLWLMILSVTGGSNNIGMGVQLNSIGGTNYNYHVNTSGDGYGSSTGGNAFLLYLPTGSAQYFGGQILFDGRVKNSLLGFNANIMATTGRQHAFGSGAVAASGDLSQIDFLVIGGVDPNNWTGKGQLFYQDLN